ncbi:MAG TPA: DUF2905 domain-containing protein [Candidatus Acidoferrales bacterium]|nr:DUF2905 domain-containing protein [Candidatus Acidoferrales bacterium]
MDGFQSIGKSLVIIGGIVVLVGLFLIMAEKVNVPFLGKLPGDIYIKRKNFQFYFPIVTCIVLSLLLSFIFYLISYFSKR